MRRYSLTARRVILVVASALIASLAVVASAPAIVLNDSGTHAGVALVPSSRGGGVLSNLSLPAGVSADTTTGSCTDPWLSGDLGGPNLPTDALCYRGGSVMHKNETFALTWDAPLPSGSERNYWSETRGYVEQFLRDVADSSGSPSSPFAVATQYQDSGGRAQNASVFGGGCIDYGVAGSSSCEFGAPTGAGHDFPTGGCNPALGDSFVAPGAAVGNSLCLTDAQIQSEVATMVSQTGIIGRTQPGYTPLVNVLLPAGVEDCLDTSHSLCSANASLTAPQPTVTPNATGGNILAGTYQVEVTYVTNNGEQLPSAPQTVTTTGTASTITISSPPAATGVLGWYAYVTQAGGDTYTRQGGGEQTIGTALVLNNPPSGGTPPPSDAAFCSYHSEVNVGGTEVAYVVQPWTPLTGCDEPDAPTFPKDPTPDQASVDVGARLVSPLSQSELAAITNPSFNSWMGRDGWEIDDNAGCAPLPQQLDSETLGSSKQSPYFLQREFNNAGALEFDPWTYGGCAPLVDLIPAFVVPSAIDQGDEVQLDGSATESTLIVPNSGYSWNFGDGTSATGPSVVHSYDKAGTYNVTLTTTDRGGNTETLTQSIQVLGATGQPAPAAPTSNGPGSGGGGSSSSALSVRLLLMPQSLKNVLRTGIAVRVSSNKAANGIATVSITRAAAKRAHIKFGKGPSVRIGIGTVASITNGTVTLRLHLSPSMAKKLTHLGHLNLTVRLALVAPGNQQVAIDAAGKY